MHPYADTCTSVAFSPSKFTEVSILKVMSRTERFMWWFDWAWWDVPKNPAKACDLTLRLSSSNLRFDILAPICITRACEINLYETKSFLPYVILL